MKQLVSIDIGSTYTKGGVFELSGDKLSICATGSVPTTQDNLVDGFETLFNILNAGSEAEIVFSSSARGGLRIVAVGIVPDLTLQAAQLAAFSAGAKIIAAYSYKLTEEDVAALNRLAPDIILFTGGTDGGNESYNLHNAKMLSRLETCCPVIYAGNRSVANSISRFFAGREIYFADNVLREIDHPQPESCREKIREVFLAEITEGKGLDRIIARAGTEPVPTPYAMFEYCKKIHRERDDFGEFCMIDLGGATTDFYSSGGTGSPLPGAIVKGLDEPKVKRTVEGDLGMRVSASAAVHSMKDFIAGKLAGTNLSFEELDSYVKLLEKSPDHLPGSAKECKLEEILALACCRGALARHAGSARKVYTSQGEVIVQKGKNLRGITTIIGTGGYLSKMPDFPVREILTVLSGDAESEILVPQNPDYMIDRQYLLPLLANLALKYPIPAVNAGMKILEKSNHRLQDNGNHKNQTG